jgi:hypothetical protein
MTDVTWCTKSSINWVQKPEVLDHSLDDNNSTEWRLLIKDCLLQGDLQLLIDADLSLPEAGYELVDGDEVAAQAEMVWLDKKAAVFSVAETEDLEVFKTKGWDCLTDPVDKSLIEKLKEKLGA